LKKLLSILFILISICSFSQQNGNEWINFSQQYFKIPIYKTGIHRLDYLTIKTTLFNLGINVSTIPTSEFQVFGREKARLGRRTSEQFSQLTIHPPSHNQCYLSTSAQHFFTRESSRMRLHRRTILSSRLPPR